MQRPAMRLAGPTPDAADTISLAERSPPRSPIGRRDVWPRAPDSSSTGPGPAPAPGVLVMLDAESSSLCRFTADSLWVRTARQHRREGKLETVAASDANSSSVPLDAAVARDFARDGAVCIRGAVSPEHVALAREAIDANLADLSPRAKRASGEEDGAFVEDFCNWTRLPAMRRFIEESNLAAIAATLMGSRTVRLYHDHVLVKEPGTRQRTPWHQDQPYYNVDGRQNVSVWLPVDPVPRPSTLEFVAGSHRGEWFVPRTFLDDDAKWFPAGSLRELPDIDAGGGDARILGWELEPGDAVFLHMLTLHAAGGVDGPHRRRVLSVRFLGDDARHAPRPWPTSPPFPGLVDELAPGAPMDHPLFPVVWRGP